MIFACAAGVKARKNLHIHNTYDVIPFRDEKIILIVLLVSTFLKRRFYTVVCVFLHINIIKCPLYFNTTDI